jgi:hypothetical protein
VNEYEHEAAYMLICIYMHTQTHEHEPYMHTDTCIHTHARMNTSYIVS